MTDSINIQDDVIEEPSPSPSPPSITTTTSTETQSHDEKNNVAVNVNTFSDEHVKKLLKVMHVYSRYTNLTHKQLPPTLVYFAQVCYFLHSKTNIFLAISISISFNYYKFLI